MLRVDLEKTPQGCAILAIDIGVGMSLPWTIIEAPCFIAAGAMVLIAQRLAVSAEAQ